MSAFDLQDAVNALGRLGCHPKQSGNNWISYCPIHEADGQGHKPSLTLCQGDRQAVLVNCHAGCDGREILKALGVGEEPRRSKEPVATYRYRDENGREIRQKVRFEPKDFRIRHKGAAGEWVYKAGDGPAVLYRLPELKAAIQEGKTVFVTEGEKDCDRLASLGLAATTNIEGAAQPSQRAKWRAEYIGQLAGAARVVLLPDNDAPGRAHMAHVAGQLAGKVGDIRWLALEGLPEKGDVSDWLAAGHTVAELEALAEAAPPPDLEGFEAEKAQVEAEDEALKKRRSKWLEGFVYLTADDLYFEVATGHSFKPPVFKQLAERAFPKCWRKEQPGLVFAREQHLFARNECYFPGQPSVIIDSDSIEGAQVTLFNVYRKPKLPAPRFNAGQQELFMDHLRYICGEDEAFLAQFLNWMATLVQKPGRRVHWVPLLISPATGTGKGLVAEVLTAILGANNVGKIDNKTIGGNFQDALMFRQLLLLDEVKLFEDQSSRTNDFKVWITDDRVPCNRKGRTQIVIDNRANFLAFSNYENALAIDRTERRYAVAVNYQGPKDSGYYRKFADAFLPKYGGDVSAVLYMLLHHDLSNFDPCAPALSTEARQSMADLNMNHSQQALKQLIDHRAGLFGFDLITFDELRTVLLEIDGGPYNNRNATLTNGAANRAAKAVGLEPLGKKRVGVPPKQAPVYCIRNCERWRKEPESSIRDYLLSRKPPDKPTGI